MEHDNIIKAAETLFKNGAYTEALDLCTELLKASPDSYQAFELRSSIRHRLGDTVGAIDDIDEILRLMPQSSAPHFRKGRYLLASGQPEEAISEFTKAEKLDNGYFGESIFFYRAEAQLRSGDYLGAINDCDKVSKGFFERDFFGYKRRTVDEIRSDARSRLRPPPTS